MGNPRAEQSRSTSLPAGPVAMGNPGGRAERFHILTDWPSGHGQPREQSRALPRPHRLDKWPRTTLGVELCFTTSSPAPQAVMGSPGSIT